ncbi:MAG: AbrB family transcriptional regulator [Oscillospiraceae bacterium]|nr:AbrB family transcriptional regulator [Oscillospiraceae bacterium]
MLYLLLLHLVGLIGGLLARKCKVPAGALLGAMVSVVALNMVTGIEQAYPLNLRFVVQVFSGILIGLTFTRTDIIMLRRMFKSVLILLGAMLTLNVLFAFIVHRFTTLDLTTALFVTAPGGMSDLALIAVDFGADTRQVAMLHVFRFGFVVLFFPFAIRRTMLRKHKENEAEKPPCPINVPTTAKPCLSTKRKALRIFLTVLVAGTGAFLARAAGVPAGALIGSVTATVIFGAGAQLALFPKKARIGVQVFAGCFLGSQITLQAVEYIRTLPGPMAIILVQVFVVAFGVSWLLRRFSTMDRTSCLFASIPGGMVEMGILAEEMGLDVPRIILMHTCRIVGVVSMMPVMLWLFVR